jgi:PAS domain S-box-containing protein
MITYTEVTTERKLAEQELRRERDRFQEYLDVAEAIIVALDRKGRITLINQKGCKLFGHRQEDLIGTDWFATCLPQPEGMSDVYPFFLKLIAGEIKAAEYFENQIITLGSELRDVAWHNALLKDDDGHIIGTLSFGEDITERKQVEEELLKQQDLLQKAQELGRIGTWELDIKKNELLWTDENYRIFGIPIGTELTYETFLQCVHPDDRKYVDTKWKASFNKKPYDIEHRLLVDGKVKWVREKAELEFNEKDECVRGKGFTQDITELKQAEEERKKL